MLGVHVYVCVRFVYPQGPRLFDRIRLSFPFLSIGYNSLVPLPTSSGAWQVHGRMARQHRRRPSERERERVMRLAARPSLFSS